MRVLVLGSAAGGGFPQWNCRCPVCDLAWSGSPKVRPRTQTSLAVSANGVDWLILDAAPDLRQQIMSSPALHPAQPGRHSPIKAVVVTSGDVDHLAGLLCLRESQRFTLYGTVATLSELSSNGIFGVLHPDNVARRPIAPGRSQDTGFGLSLTPFVVPGKVPLYREGEQLATDDETEQVIGLDISDGSRRVSYVPGCARITPQLAEYLDGTDLLFFDGTTFTDDEMPKLGVSQKTAARMGHLAMTGPSGSLHGFAKVRIGRKVYIHLNNTNPVLIEDSAERRATAEAGWDVAFDGMELVV